VKCGEFLQISLRGPAGQCRLLVPSLRDETLADFALVIGGRRRSCFTPIGWRDAIRSGWLWTFTNTSSRCQRRCRKCRIASTRFRLISAAKIVPNRFHQKRTVSCVMSMPRQWSRSSQQVLDVPERQRVSDNHHHSQADDLGRRLEGAKDARAAHAARLPPACPPASRFSSDRARWRVERHETVCYNLEITMQPNNCTIKQ